MGLVIKTETDWYDVGRGPVAMHHDCHLCYFLVISALIGGQHWWGLCLSGRLPLRLINVVVNVVVSFQLSINFLSNELLMDAALVCFLIICLITSSSATEDG